MTLTRKVVVDSRNWLVDTAMLAASYVADQRSAATLKRVEQLQALTDEHREWCELYYKVMDSETGRVRKRMLNECVAEALRVEDEIDAILG